MTWEGEIGVPCDAHTGGAPECSPLWLRFKCQAVTNIDDIILQRPKWPPCRNFSIDGFFPPPVTPTSNPCCGPGRSISMKHKDDDCTCLPLNVVFYRDNFDSDPPGVNLRACKCPGPFPREAASLTITITE